MILDIILAPFLAVYRMFHSIFSILNRPVNKKTSSGKVEQALDPNSLTSADAVKSEKKKRYKYRVRDAFGKVSEGIFDAYSKVEVHSFLLSQSYEVISIEEDKISTSLGLVQLSQTKKMNYKDLNFFLTQLSTYIKSGIPLVDSLAILSRQVKKRGQKGLYQRLVFELNSGLSFSEAIKRQGTVFPNLLINMLKTAELTGDLTDTLDDMADYYRTVDFNRKQIISALTYPSVVFVFSVAVLTFILVYVVPNFVDMFGQMGADLPFITVIVINLSNFITNNVVTIIVIIVAIIVLLVTLYKNISSFRYLAQSLLMHIPVVKNIIIYSEVITFTKTFASLINHDVFITDSMEILGKITNNEVYKQLIRSAVINLSNGDGVSKAFKGHWAFPDTAYEMLVTGEKTGRLGTMMSNVATYYQEEQKNLVTQLKSLIEPIMIVFLAITVGIILLAVIYPMFSMYGQIG